MPILHVGARTLDSHDLTDRAHRLAGGLRALGLNEGDVVAVVLRNSVEYADVINAGKIAGTYYCPVNWHFTPEEIGAQIADCGARVVIGHGDLLSAAAAALPGDATLLSVGDGGPPSAQNYDRWLAEQATYDGPEVAPRGHIAYTSGTTGRPKAVVRGVFPPEERSWRLQRMQDVVEATFGIKPGCRVLMPAPIYHSGPSVIMQNALTQAEVVVVHERFDAEAVLADIERHKIDTLYLVPVMYVRMLRLPAETRAKYDVSTLRFVGSTGAPCAPDIKRAMIDWFGPIINETYASSEAGMVTVIGAEEALARPGSAGRAIPGAEVKIFREDHTPADVGEVGLIYVRQPAYPDFTYRDNDQARQEIEHAGMISLGDLGYLDDEDYLYVCDRASDMVISGGVNIYPAEVENRLLARADIADCAVFGVPDAEFGERLHAVVQPVGSAPLDASELIEWMRAGLASYKVPRSIEIAELPRDDNGKIAKRKLRASYWEGQERRV
ncbi:long-chain acyl-CoA synthetase [Antricoccus suffuscus]|uniref:Long-chain acyl-CoA synthetase n=1 Tax=Antricoccus suffuscus TaxID=1629062 RepID=A0A2T0ZWN9_9ACTN|nr:AMP-binding protein [Antricoccus suffuscus]PRZ40769.1 long-chain acyl-CoA synthetase [Antricoccus suffuscus]